MIRLLGVVFLLMLVVGGLGWFLGWFTLSTSGDGVNTHINVVVDQQKMKADEERAKTKLDGLTGKSK